MEKTRKKIKVGSLEGLDKLLDQVVRTKQKRRLTTKAENTFYQCQ
jgi:hypothetical protein